MHVTAPDRHSSLKSLPVTTRLPALRPLQVPADHRCGGASDPARCGRERRVPALRWWAFWGYVVLSVTPCLIVAGCPVVQGADDFTPQQVNLPVAPPADAIVLFDGKGTNRFLSMAGTEIDWPVTDGALESTRGQGRTNHLVSEVHFRDAEIHAEFILPAAGSGNSGLYIHGNYEFQIFNSAGKSTPGMGDIGALYGFAKPLVNACRQPGEWQVVDIRYRAPRRDDRGKITAEGVLTAWLNGRLVQDQTTFGEPRSKYHPFRYGTTPFLKQIWQRQKRTMVGPLFLQDHDSPVRFRNVWIRPLDGLATTYRPRADE